MRPRLPDWRERLVDFIAARRAVPFDWPAHNCALLWADAIVAMTGQDVAANLRGFRDAAAAARGLKRAGFDGVRAFCAATFEPIARPLFGDGVLVPSDDPRAPLEALMIADGRGCAWGQDEAGLVRLALPPGVTFWRA